MYSLGCIIYEFFTLNNYFGDKFNNSIKKIDSGIYNYKWQEIHYYKMIIKKEWI